jgi:hypothetical protein
LRRRRNQLHPRYIFIDPDLVAARATHLDRRVHLLTLCLVFVTLEAFLGVCVLIQGHWVCCCIQTSRSECQYCYQDRPQNPVHYYTSDKGMCISLAVWRPPFPNCETPP